MSDNQKPDMVSQRVFDAIVDMNGSASIADLQTATGLNESRLRTALLALRSLGVIKGVHPTVTYELTEQAQRPTDHRGKKKR